MTVLDPHRRIARTEPSMLIENEPYIIIDGQAAGTVFLYQFRHKRPFLSMGDVVAFFGEHYKLKEIAGMDAAAIPNGPYVPRAKAVPFEQALLATENIDDLREALCHFLDGNGYEIGAGDRPTRVPLGCWVTYVDQFTFDEARDASFAGADRERKNFVKVAYYEAMDQLNSVIDSSASFFIACHVIEHARNVIRSIRKVNQKLKPGGYLVLAVPDKRYTFDAGRPTTTLEHFVAEDLQCAPSLQHYLEFARRAEHLDDWVKRGLERHARAADLHHHCFTPDSMRELLTYMDSEMHFDEATVFEHGKPETVREFYVRLKKNSG
jgi:SAM-dependent methyltransferase